MTTPAFDPAAGLLAVFDHVEAIADFAARRRRSYELLALRAGASVADIGCGAGTAVCELSALVGADGVAAGVDINAPLLDVARARAAERGAKAAFHEADAASLPFATGSLHGYRAERVYQHLPRPVEALAEARRVLAPGGRIVILDLDWDGLLIDGEPALTRRIVDGWRAGMVGPTIGRQLRRLLLDAGFTDVTVDVEASASTSFAEYGWLPTLAARTAGLTGAVREGEADDWLRELRERDAQGRFFLAMTHVLASGRR